MKANPNIDELLCSFIDGELPLRQQTEVRRLVARDPEVGRRLRQLQNCKTLVGALPRAEAPDEMLEQIKHSLERRTLLAEQAVTPRVSTGAWNLVLRKCMAAAAMVALLAVLGAVVYQIVAPVSHTDSPGSFAGAPSSERNVPGRVSRTVADAGFSGRLELCTGALVQTDAVIKAAIEENGLMASVESDDSASTRIYRLVSTRQGIRRMVTALGGVWGNFETATLYVDRPEVFDEAVSVKAVTPMQAASIVTQDSAQASLEMARDCAVLNGIAEEMPGKEMLASADSTTNMLELTTIPRPEMAQHYDSRIKTLAATEGDAEASLTIVLRSLR
jgi:hypothetical protein